MRRISSKQKTEMVLRVIRGETLDEVSRSEEVSLSDLSNWRDRFLASGSQGLKQLPQNSKEAEYERVIGRLQMENELLKKKTSFKNRRSL